MRVAGSNRISRQGASELLPLFPTTRLHESVEGITNSNHVRSRQGAESLRTRHDTEFRAMAEVTRSVPEEVGFHPDMTDGTGITLG